MRVCFATNNQHKLQEVQHMLGKDFQVITLSDVGCDEELAEDKSTMEGNSWQKAAYVYEHYSVPCFADDSGLEVAALQGAPGVYSARYAGPQRDHDDNMNLLLRNMKDITDRSAQFRAVITYIAPGVFQQFEGIVKGSIALSKTGTMGFGYDPLFIPEGYSQTFAEMGMDQKNKFSHRAMAVRKFVEFLKR